MEPRVLESLIDQIGKDKVHTDSETLDERRFDYWVVSHLRDWRGEELARPGVVVRPESVTDVQAIVRVAAETRTPLVPFGLGSGVCGGIQPDPSVILVDVSAMNRVREIDETSLLEMAAAAEQGSEHPLGRSIVEQAQTLGLSLDEVSEFSAVRGKGVVAGVEGKTILVGSRKLMADYDVDVSEAEEIMRRLEDEAKTAMLVAVDGRLAGVVAVADTLKEDSVDAIAELHRMGLQTAMITGDNRRTAEAIARRVGIDHVLAEVLPDGKVHEVQKLQDQFGLVAFVGDGINDAPALTQANVGIAIGTGTDIAIEASDITLVRGELTGVVEAINLSVATFAKIRQNLFWAFFYNVAMIPLAIIGWMHPVLAEIAMATSSITVVTNANRLRNVDIRPSYRREAPTAPAPEPSAAPQSAKLPA